VDCSDYKTQFVSLIKGHLDPGESADLEKHLAECETCRGIYKETEWLINGLYAARGEIRDNHISSSLLFHFVRSPRSLDSETVDWVRTHLDRCGQCRQDAAFVKQQLGVGVEDDTSIKKTPGRRPGFWHYVFRRHLVPVYTAVAVVAVVLILWIVSTDDGSLPTIAKVMSYDEAQRSGYPVVTLAAHMTTRGENPAAILPPVITESNERALVLTMEAVTFQDEEMSYGVQITGLDGNTIWQSDVTVDQLASGNLWLVVDRNDFESGIYRLSVLERQGDYRAPISTAHFEIKR
jgi:hypothetical protein